VHSVDVPSIEHETLVQLLKSNPQLAPYLLASAGYEVPAGVAVVTDSNLSDPEHELRADVVVVSSGGRLAIVSEVQTSSPGTGKRRAWHSYLANAARDHGCKAALLVLAIDQDVARRCAKPYFPGHPQMVLRPIVKGPVNTPHPDEPGAEHVAAELAVLWVLNGGFDLAVPPVRQYVMGKLAKAGPQNRKLYVHCIYLAATPAIRKALEDEVNDRFRVEFFDAPIEEAEAQALAKGEARGEARLLLHVLCTRGFVISDSIRDLVMSSNDTAQIEEWCDRAMIAGSLTEIFFGGVRAA
jgi:hypothetical protein